MQRLDVLLLDGLLRDEGNVRLTRGRADRLGVVAVVLLSTHERLHVLRADDLHLVPERLELALPIKCARAGFYDDHASVDLREDREELIARHPALQNNPAVAVHAMELEHVLGEIDAEGLDGHRHSPLSQALSLRGGRESRPSH